MAVNTQTYILAKKYCAVHTGLQKYKMLKIYSSMSGTIIGTLKTCLLLSTSLVTKYTNLEIMVFGLAKEKYYDIFSQVPCKPDPVD